MPRFGHCVSTGHGAHASMLSFPVVVPYVPLGHLVQSSSDIAAVVVPKVPAGHASHALRLPELDVPAMQSYCAAEDVTSSQYFPGGHGVHSVCAPSLKLPKPHAAFLDPSVAGHSKPSAHSVHALTVPPRLKYPN